MSENDIQELRQALFEAMAEAIDNTWVVNKTIDTSLGRWDVYIDRWKKEIAFCCYDDDFDDDEIDAISAEAVDYIPEWSDLDEYYDEEYYKDQEAFGCGNERM